jgi:hypothetical protein
MELNMRDTMSMARNMDREYFSGLTTQSTLVTSITIIFMEREFTLGVMVVNMKGNGKIIRCMAMVPSPGLMAESMWDSIMMIKNKAMENLSGLMEDHIKETGTMENNMEKEFM